MTRNKKAAALWYFNKHLCYNDRGQKCILWMFVAESTAFQL
ncbi:hypothetical protein HMPREF9429_01500 [Megasphaera micronuciformis F0359]|uniref:Uncharacterized protein n=1 Tax=Megasphaera micronuciformis F0359 TaxID=706434 RepID=E2ZDJ7_9FIRM|nr:hypothetical protein HMPREF9429_01500 [Megasphaera micronuciformis F0359]